MEIRRVRHCASRDTWDLELDATGQWFGGRVRNVGHGSQVDLADIPSNAHFDHASRIASGIFYWTVF